MIIKLDLPTLGVVEAVTYQLDSLLLLPGWRGAGANLKLVEGCRLLWEVGVLAVCTAPNRPWFGLARRPSLGVAITVYHSFALGYWWAICILFRVAIPVISSARKGLVYASVMVVSHIVPLCILLVLLLTEESVRSEWP
jgi:hypothetical protein